MDSERSAESSALTKNKKLMFVCGQRRYVEVIQCSGDEMAVVLQQGLPAPPLSTLPQSAGVLPTAFWSLPPPSATHSTDLPLLLQQRAAAIPLPSAPGISTYYRRRGVFLLLLLLLLLLQQPFYGSLNCVRDYPGEPVPER